ncbi:hypothetical protein V1264_021205 [Littorina saxatilis]|uniref:Reverse transcriptase/retrotransposon-derived protein RNase H-like domain-containing protein n=1 Tax=Littorina saxatilis TaxID=31220 RepID=A0AAN9AHS1_9CAEN
MGLVFNEDKCYIKRKQVKFFGMIYDADGVHPDPEKTTEIKNLRSPKNLTELQQFLGMVQYMSSFIPRLAHHTAALRALTKKDVQWEWNSSHQKAFQKVKDMICEDTALTYFDITKPAVVQVDASQQGLGATLIQDDKPIAFASKAQRLRNGMRTSSASYSQSCSDVNVSTPTCSGSTSLCNQTTNPWSRFRRRA